MFRRTVLCLSVCCWSLTPGCEKSPPPPTPPPSGKSGVGAAKQPTPQTPAAQPTNPSGQPAKPPASTVQTPQPSGAGPRWVCDQPVTDFGEVWAGETVQRTVTFRNAGTEVLKIEEPKAHCSCSSSPNWTREVPPGGTGIIPFVLKTDNKPYGQVNEYLTIETNDPSNKSIQVWLKGLVRNVCNVEVVYDASYERDKAAGKPVQDVVKTKASFGKISANDRLHRVLKLLRTNPEPLSLTMRPLPANARFQVEFREMIPGDEYQLTLIGEPPFTVGQWNMPVQFATNIPQQPTYTLYIYAQVPPRVEVIPDRIVYDPKKYAGRDRPIRIINHGPTPVGILSVATSEPQYQITLLPPNPAAPEEQGVKVTLPGDGYQVPAYGEAVEITTSDPEFPVIRVPVLPTMNATAPRPPDQPLQLYPVPLGPLAP